MRATAPDRSALRVDALLGRGPRAPEPITPARRDGRRPLAVILGTACVLVLGAVWLRSPHDEVTVRMDAAPAPLGTMTAGIATDVVVVDVEGDVVKPGLVTLPLGSRVADAIAAAGGLSRPLAVGQVNLAARLDDGQLIVVGAPAVASVDKRVSLNNATVEQLDTLPGVGPVLAARIITWRDTHRRFTSVDQLAEVPGIGSSLLAALKPLVRL